MITTIISLIRLFLKAKKYKLDFLLIVTDPTRDMYNISGIVSNPELVISTLNNIVSEMCYKYKKMNNSAEHWSHPEEENAESEQA